MNNEELYDVKDEELYNDEIVDNDTSDDKPIDNENEIIIDNVKMTNEDFNILSRIYSDILESQVLSETQIKEMKSLLDDFKNLNDKNTHIFEYTQKLDEIVTKLNNIAKRDDEEILDNFSKIAQEKAKQATKEFIAEFNNINKQMYMHFEQTTKDLTKIRNVANETTQMINTSRSKFQLAQNFKENWGREMLEIAKLSEAEVSRLTDIREDMNRVYNNGKRNMGIGIGIGIGACLVVLFSSIHLLNKSNVYANTISALNPVYTDDKKYIALDNSKLLKDNKGNYFIKVK